MFNLLQELRHALRSLAKTPGFTAVVAVTLALGIGANAAIFSVVNAVLLQPLPYAHPERLVRLFETFHNGDGYGTASMPNLRDWREGSTALESISGYTYGSVNLQGIAEPERLRSVEVTDGTFTMLGVRPILGRFIGSTDKAVTEPNVAVLSETLWRSRYGADPSVLGRTLTLDENAFTVVGVMPDTFDFPPGGSRTDVWLPLDTTSKQASNRGSHYIGVVGRLKPGVAMDTALTELRAVAARLEQEYPNEQSGRSVRMTSLHESAAGYLRPALAMLLGAVGFVLLIACANVANLTLARSAVRRREAAIRVALGASRFRLMRQSLVESLVLAFLGAALGSVCAYGLLKAMNAYASTALPTLHEVQLSGVVFLFLLAIAVLTGLAFGLLPALQASRPDLRKDLADSGVKSTSSRGQKRLRSTLVVAEVALSLVLLAGAGLLLRAFMELRATPTGMDIENVLTMHVSLSGVNQAAEAGSRFFRPVLERIRAIPGVKAAGMISHLPMQAWGTNSDFTIEGRPAPPEGQGWLAEMRTISPQLPEALGIPLKSGRLFTEQDGDTGVKPVLINETLAKRYFPNEDPVGHRIDFGDEDRYEIIGVLGDVRHAGLDEEARAEVDFPYLNRDLMSWSPEQVLVVKTSVPQEALLPAIRSAVQAVDPDQPVFSVRTMEQVLERSLSSRKLMLFLLGTFAAVALLMSAAGIYGVISYLVTQRTREFGIRMALGAQKGDVVRLVLAQGFTLLGIGVAIGLAGALGLTRWLQGMLAGIEAADPLTFASVVVVLGLVALLACLIPARRAMKVDPVVALHYE